MLMRMMSNSLFLLRRVISQRSIRVNIDHNFFLGRCKLFLLCMNDGHSIFLMMIHTMNVTLPNGGYSIFLL